jgi:diguanylate cyclase (GGDEF)-like protein
MSLVARVVEFTVGAMAFVEQDDVDIELLLNRRASPAVVDEAKARMQEAIVAARGGVAVGRVRARLFAPPGSGHSAEETTLDAFASFPVETNDRLAGMLVLTGRAVGKMTPETRAFLAQVANQAHIVLENSRLFERVRNLAIRDSLTDLFNHRHIMDLVHHEFERVGRYQNAFSVLMVDADHFKRINDEHGHPVGDEVLRMLARVLMEETRDGDVAARYGGEEFIVALSRTAATAAHAVAERIRERIVLQRVPVESGTLSVTVSIGVAVARPGETGIADMIRRADHALYEAKRAGRNRVVMAEDPPALLVG